MAADRSGDARQARLEPPQGLQSAMNSFRCRLPQELQGYVCSYLPRFPTVHDVSGSKGAASLLLPRLRKAFLFFCLQILGHPGICVGQAFFWKFPQWIYIEFPGSPASRWSKNSKSRIYYGLKGIDDDTFRQLGVSEERKGVGIVWSLGI